MDQDIVTGYDKALQLLVDKYGAVVEHDPVAGIDVVSFPDAEDPYDLLATALLEEYLDGRQLVEYFKSLELNSVGVTGGTYEAAKPRGRQLRFPDDPYFTSQWNLQATNLLKAQLLPEGVGLKDGVRVAILDSGINESDARHDGLDGVRSIEHIWTAPATGFSDNHGLAVTSLLADQGNDGDGPVGLMGSIDASCGEYQTAFTQRPADVLSYSVGAWGPMSNFVISALHQAIKEDGADIVLMNFRMAYSPQVQMAIEEAIERGVIVVAAAGNYHPAHRTKPVGFPASVEGVISVGSANRGKKASRFSAVGAVILAPGEDIVVGLPDGVWAYGSGTSFAAPHVAATAALIKLIDPEITSPEIGALLQETASGSSRPSWRPRRGGSSGGEGFLDAEGAVEAVLKGSGDDGDGHHIGPRNVWGHLGECDLGKTGETFAASEVPIEAALKGNYPNPFNPT
ncbi:MAG: S8 family serine peptidase, partial [Rhodothermales bacterium]